MKVLGIIMIAVLLHANAAFTQLPSGNNIWNEWSQGSFDDIRVFYAYSTDPDNFHCRIDYYYDGTIKLIAVEEKYSISGEKLSDTTTSYFLRPIPVRGLNGNELVRISYRILLKELPNLKVEPTINTEDTFTKYCVPLLPDLFNQIPAPEVQMFKDQYGSVFGIQ